MEMCSSLINPMKITEFKSHGLSNSSAVKNENLRICRESILSATCQPALYKNSFIFHFMEPNLENEHHKLVGKRLLKQ